MLGCKRLSTRKVYPMLLHDSVSPPWLALCLHPSRVYFLVLGLEVVPRAMGSLLWHSSLGMLLPWQWLRSLNDEESIFHGPRADMGSLGEGKMLCRTLTAASVTAGAGKHGVDTFHGV